MKRLAVLLLGVALLAGCSVAPFRETPPVCMAAVDPQQLLAQYREALPERLQLLNSVVFAYRWRAFTGIGLLEIDRPAQTFRIVCLNPLGVKLFELSGDAQQTEAHFVMPPLLEQGGDFAGTVGEDIRRIYFDVVPAPAASIVRQRHAIVFRQPSGDGVLEYVFAGVAGDLAEKRFYDAADDLVWKVSYYEYREDHGKRSPQGIVLVNYRHGYRLTVRPKESAS
jgi:hypothetical protein